MVHGESHSSLVSWVRDGGLGLDCSSAIVRSRPDQDIIAKWEAADSAWQVLQGTLLTPEISRTEKALNDLLVQLRDAIPLYGIEDVQEAEKFPWAICIYSLIGTCILCCCCAFVLWPCLRTKSVGKKDELKHADEPPAAAEEI
eukprot:g6150.t1